MREQNHSTSCAVVFPKSKKATFFLLRLTSSSKTYSSSGGALQGLVSSICALSQGGFDSGLLGPVSLEQRPSRLYVLNGQQIVPTGALGLPISLTFVHWQG